MHLRRSLFACAVGLLLAVPAFAQNAAGPALIVQAQSLDELLGRLKTTVKNFVPDEIYKEFEQHALPNLDPKKLPGVDSKRPFGLYATVDASIVQGDFSKSHVVALIPVANERDFLALLDKAGAKATQQKDEGLYALEVPIPDFPVPVFVRFAKQYAYISVGSSAAVGPKAMLDPKDVLTTTEKAAAAVHVHIDRIPKEAKDFILGKLDEMGGFVKDLPLPAQELKDAFDKYMKFALRQYKQGLQDGKELAYRFDLEPKGGLVLEGTVTPKPNTTLAKSIAGIPAPQNRYAGLVGRDSAAQGFLSLPLYVPEFQEIAVALTEFGAKQAQADLERSQAPKEAREAVAEFFAALKRTFQAGTLDAAGSLRGPNKDGKFSAVSAITLKDTAPFEKALKAALKIAPPPVANLVKLDAHKAGERSVHEISVGATLPPEMQRVFGRASVYLCFAPDAVCVSFGENGVDLIKEALNAKAGPAPTFSVEVNGKRMADLVKAAAGKDAEAGLTSTWLSLLGKQERFVLLSVEVQGGEQFRVRANYGILPFLMLGVSARAEFQPAQPPVPAKDR